MEDILLMQFLRKKGIISDKDMHEFHELTTANLDHQSINNTDYLTQHLQKTNEQDALNIVSECIIQKMEKSISEKNMICIKQKKFVINIRDYYLL